MVAVELGSICGPNLVTWIWFLFLCVVPHGHCDSSKQLWTQSDCPVHHCSVPHCCLEGPQVATLQRPWYLAGMVRRRCSLGSCYSLVTWLLAGRDISRWPAVAVAPGTISGSELVTWVWCQCLLVPPSGFWKNPLARLGRSRSRTV